MRLVILSFFTDLVERGVEVYVDQLARRLSRHFSVEVISLQGLSLKCPPYTGRENMLFRRLYLDRTSIRIGQATRSVLSHLKKNPPDVIYPVNNGWQSLLAKLFCLKHRTKLVLAGHSGPGWDDRVNLWLKPDAFIAFSKIQARWARGVNPRVRVELIPHGVDISQFQPSISNLRLKLSPPIFVSVSALTQQGRAGETPKNIDLTLKAVARLKRGSLLLLGSGPDAARIDKLAKQLLPGPRYRRFSVSHNIIQQYYRAADVFTLVSGSSEAFGLSFLEALACNLPVISVDDPLRREIIGPAGILIKNPNNIDEYAGGLAQALEKNWGNTPRLQAQTYSWDNSIKLYENLFKKLTPKPYGHFGHYSQL